MYVQLLEKRWSFNWFNIITLTNATNLSILSQTPDVHKFLANLVVKLVLLLTLTFWAILLTLRSFWLIKFELFWILKWVVWLTYRSLKWNINKNWENLEDLDISHWFWFWPVLYGVNSLIFFINSFKINTLKGLVA